MGSTSAPRSISMSMRAGGEGLRAFASLGAAFSTDGATAHFVGASVGGFTSEVALPRRHARIGAGVEMAGEGRYTLRADHEGAFGSGLETHAIALRAGIRF
ncbi:hypothetical protein [Amaricoccus solimangrovi]|uniref:Autotransporter domain-containing protein n=1 Tax=Amaricoccus solimangrovi TaxID=2589815 RepID=A0A501WSD9_9RHOB|nr:hypothetical protein [Amaricoccus solimangrovi]TPE51004.1 hypothetical protein FJM51_10230 [Amaricoccus solimangrovi]